MKAVLFPKRPVLVLFILWNVLSTYADLGIVLQRQEDIPISPAFALPTAVGQEFVFSSTAYTAHESYGFAEFTVLRTGGGVGEARVDVVISNGTATAGSDFLPPFQTNVLSYSFADGETNVTISFEIINDDEFEGIETLSLTLVHPMGDALGNPSVATVTILDDDPPSDPVKPAVTIQSPLAGVRLNNSTVTLRGTARGHSSVTNVQYRVENTNGTSPYLSAQSTNQWTNWIVTVEGLAPGTNWVRVRARDSSGGYSDAAIRAVVYVASDFLVLKTNGAGMITGATNGQRLEIGKSYTLKVTPKPGNLFSNWIVGGIIFTNPMLKFQMASNLQVCANLVTNPFRALKGAYNGLFQPMAELVSHDNAGFMTFHLTDKGSFSGKLLLAGAAHPFSGQFDLELQARKTIARGTNTSLDVNLQLMAGTDLITGTVSNPAWSSDLLGHRALFDALHVVSSTPIKYTALLSGVSDPASSPFGQGAATLGITPVGNVMFKGMLADGQVASQMVPVSIDGKVPLYVNLYGGKGSLFGWVQLAYDDINDVVASLLWTKRSGVTSPYYAAGFTNTVTTLGSYYTNRPAGTPVVTLSNATVLLTEGNLPAPLTNDVVLSPLNKITVTSTNTNKLTLTVTAATGQFSGSFVNPGTRKPSLIKGVLLQKHEMGGGFFLGTNQSGRVYFEPVR
jgi:hypothetical protein